MSDISIQLPWWFGPLAALAGLFLPLLAAALAASLWLWFKRSLLVARIVAVIALGLFAISAAVNLYTDIDQAKSKAAMDADLKARTRTLARPTIIAGIHLPAGTVVTKAGEGDENSIEALDLPHPADVRSAPVIGHVEFQDGGIHGSVTLARDALIAGIPCSRKSPASFLNGRFVGCTLSRPSVVRDVPCTGVVDLNVGITCTLNVAWHRYGYTWPAGTKVQDAPSQATTYFITKDGTGVGFKGAQLSDINPGTHGVHYRGCLVTSITVDRENVRGQLGRVCSLGSEGASIALPASFPSLVLRSLLPS